MAKINKSNTTNNTDFQTYKYVERGKLWQYLLQRQLLKPIVSEL